MYLKRGDWGVLATAVVLFHLVGTALVRYFYAHHIAHYDSVGSLIQSISTLEVYRQSGYVAGLAHAWDTASLSITQNMFPAVFALFIDATPAGLQTYNSAAAAVAMLGIALLLRRAGLPMLGVLFGFACLWVGDALYWWDLGAFDYRRDFAMSALLCGSLCLGVTSFAYNHSRANEIAVCLLFGVVTGLTLISRDSAPLIMIGCLVMPMAALAAYSGFKDGWLIQARKVGFSLAGFLPFAVMLIMKLPDLLARLSNPLVMYGGDPDQKDTFISTIRRVPDVVLGQFTYPYNKAPWITPLVVCVILIAFAVLAFWRRRHAADVPVVDVAGNPRATVFLLATAVWIPVFIHVQLAFFMKFGSYHPPIVGIAPYLPVLVGLSAALFAGLIYFSREIGMRNGKVLAAVVIAIIAISVPARAMTRLIQYPPGTMTKHEQMVRMFGAAEQPPVLAVLTERSELLRVVALQLMAKMKGLQAPALLRYEAEGYGQMDYQVAIPAEPAHQQLVLEAMNHATRCNADFIVLDTKASSYSRDGINLLLYSKGAPMVAGLLEDLAQRPRLALSADGSTVMIDNQDRSACVTASQ